MAVDDVVDTFVEANGPTKVSFDPAKHLNFTAPKKIFTMKEIGFEHQGVSPNAVSEPFPLFTPEAIQLMRNEVLSDPVLRNCQYSSNLAQSQLRGFAAEYAPFVYDAWRHPETLKIVSSIAGIDLTTVMDFEIAHINLSLNKTGGQKEAQKTMLENTTREADEALGGCLVEDDKPIVDWHTDSYPFVCVLMLSDCTNMVGGETALRTGSGGVMKVRGPGMGNAVVLQGRYIEHQAMRAIGGNERITMVTSFRPKSSHVPDDTVLTTVRAISDLSALYGQYSEYRLEMLEERLRKHQRELRAHKAAHRRFNTAGTKAFLTEQKAFIESMLEQLVDDDKVTVGLTDDTHLLSNDLKVEARKKAKLFAAEST